MSSVSYITPIPTHEKIFAVGKSGPNATFNNLFFLELGWPWVGEFDGFIIIFICAPTHQNWLNRTHLGITFVDTVIAWGDGRSSASFYVTGAFVVQIVFFVDKDYLRSVRWVNFASQLL